MFTFELHKMYQAELLHEAEHRRLVRRLLLARRAARRAGGHSVHGRGARGVAG